MIQMSDIVAQAEYSHPDSSAIVTGNFNKANPKKDMPKFMQEVTCAKRDGLPCADLQTTTEVC